MASTCAAANVLLLLSLMVVVATGDNYVPQDPPPTTNTPDIAIEGHILCNSDNKTYPIQGAKVKVVCLIVDSYGKLVAKVTVPSYPTDLNGYFYFVMYGLINKVKDINSCRVKLESSPVLTCKTPTNVNKGVTGATLSSNSSNFLSHDNLNLYTLEPFYFSSPADPKLVYY